MTIFLFLTNFLIAGITHAEIVEEVDGSIVMVGGRANGVEYVSILRLRDATSEWEELPQKLMHQRMGHVAFLVPDAYAECVPSSK